MVHQTVKAILVGLGRVAVGYAMEQNRPLESSHFGALLNHPKIDGLILVDNDTKRLEQVKAWVQTLDLKDKVVSYAEDYVEAIKAHQPELAVIATPTSTHYEIMLEAIHRNGPQAICLEKPVGASLDEANKIANRAAYIYGLTDQTKPKVCVHFDRRWHPNWCKVKELLDEGKIGKPLLAIGHHPGPLLRSGIHMLDLFNWYFGSVKEVRSLIFVDSWMTKKYPETDDVAYNAEIFYQNGARTLLLGADLAGVDYQLFELEIYGTNGAIKASQNGGLITVRPIMELKEYGGLKGLFDVLGQHVAKDVNPMGSMIDDLVSAVEDPKHQLASNLEDGVQAQMLVGMIRQSKGNWITPDNVDPAESVKSI